jgi:toxin YoeB
MQIIYTPDAQEDLKYWLKTGNKPILKKILQLTNAIIESPFEGIGKPEPLKYDFTGLWSRRITQEHRYVYSVEEDILSIHSLKGHYE